MLEGSNEFHDIHVTLIATILARANPEQVDGRKKIEEVLATMPKEVVEVLADWISEVTLKAFSPESKDLFE